MSDIKALDTDRGGPSDRGFQEAQEMRQAAATERLMRVPTVGAVACAATVLVAGAVASTAAIRPRYGAEVERGYIGQLVDLDPLTASSFVEREVARQLHAGLYRFDADGQPCLDLAERAEAVAGGDAVRIVLRPAWFHDGTPVTAEDVRRSLERYIRTAATGRLLAAAHPFVSVEVQSERVFVLRVASAPGIWPWLLADVRASIVPAKAEQGVGAGPFRLDASTGSGPTLRLLPYLKHHRGRPLLDAVVYRAFPDERALDFALRHQGTAVIDSIAAEIPGVGTVGAGVEVVALWINDRADGLELPAGRRAVVAALSRQAIIDVVLGGRVEAIEGLLQPPASTVRRLPPEAVDPVAPSRNLELLHPSGAGLESVASRLRVDLHTAGIATRVVGRDWAPFRAALAARRFDLALVVLRLGEIPAPIRLAETAELLQRVTPEALRRQAMAGSPTASARDLYAAEQEILGQDVVELLYQRRRRLQVASSVRDLGLDPDGTAVFENAWRWPRP